MEVSPRRIRWEPVLVLFICTAADAQVRWETCQFEVTATAEQTNTVARFPFKNVGTNTVRILDLRSSCGCTTATLEKKTYQSGEKGELTANFVFGQRVGLQEKTILVQTDDPKTPTTILKLRVHIPEVLKINPPFVFWKVGEPTISKELTLTAGE